MSNHELTWIGLPGPVSAVPVPAPCQEVLVVGQGLSALQAAAQAADLGHAVLLATPGDPSLPALDEEEAQVAELAARLPEAVEVLEGYGLASLSGAAGDFSATLGGPEGARCGRFGAVALAPPVVWAPTPLPQGLGPEQVRLLSQLGPADLEGPTGGWIHAAVLAGTEAPLSAAAFSRALITALTLQQYQLVQVTLFFSEARVGFPGGERLWQNCRQAGVIAVRVAPGGLKAGQDESGRPLLAWSEALLGEQMELVPQLTVLVEEAVAPLPACLDNLLLMPSPERLRPEGNRLAGGLTLRSGLYVLGAARGTYPGQPRLAEAASAVGELHQRLSQGGAPLAYIRKGACARCLTCVRACPHGALRHREGVIVCAPAACVGCGICAAECPAQAIAPAGWENAQVFSALEQALATAPSPAVVLMACANSGQQALRELQARGHAWPAGLLALPLPCAGRVGWQLLLKAFELGAAGVLVAACHEGNCRSEDGPARASIAVKQAQASLAALGLEPGRIALASLAGNQPLQLAQAIEEIFQALGENK